MVVFKISDIQIYIVYHKDVVKYFLISAIFKNNHLNVVLVVLGLA